MNLKDEFKKLRDTELTYPIEYFIEDALKVCEYAKEDGFSLEEMVISLSNYNGKTDDLHYAYGRYYDEKNRVHKQYESIAGYLQCIGHDIYMIDKKLNMT